MSRIRHITVPEAADASDFEAGLRAIKRLRRACDQHLVDLQDHAAPPAQVRPPPSDGAPLRISAPLLHSPCGSGFS